MPGAVAPPPPHRPTPPGEPPITGGGRRRRWRLRRILALATLLVTLLAVGVLGVLGRSAGDELDPATAGPGEPAPVEGPAGVGSTSDAPPEEAGSAGPEVAERDPGPALDGELLVAFLDVGQGDATLLVAPDATILVDTGRHDRDDVVGLIRDHGVEHLDVVVVTHAHADHIGQLDRVLRELEVAAVPGLARGPHQPIATPPPTSGLVGWMMGGAHDHQVATSRDRTACLNRRAAGPNPSHMAPRARQRRQGRGYPGRRPGRRCSLGAGARR